MALTVNKCCICIELRTGCLIIGYVNLVAAIIVTVPQMFLLMMGGEVVASSSSLSEKPDEQRALAAAGTVLMIVSGTLLLILSALLAFIIVLLVGLYQNKRGHVGAYLIYSYIFLMLKMLAVLVTCAFSEGLDAQAVIENLIFLPLFTYFSVVIRSYYLKMDDRKRQQIYNAA